MYKPSVSGGISSLIGPINSVRRMQEGGSVSRYDDDTPGITDYLASFDAPHGGSAASSDDGDIFDSINYYLPVGDRLRAVATLINEINPLTGLRRSMAAAGRGDVVESATELLSSVPIPASVGARLAMRAVPEVVSGVAPMTDDAMRAIIRQSDEYRGEGPWRTSMRSDDPMPFGTRTTAQSQIDDMVSSGTVRPPVGGYQGQAVMYFGGTDSSIPRSIMNRPNPSKPYTIVAPSSVVAGREGAIPIDELQHVWTMRDGEMVDVLQELIRRNNQYGSGMYRGGLVRGGIGSLQMKRVSR